MLYLMGADEAGRGPLAGDVYAAAVVLDAKNPIMGLNDSKKLSEKKREQLAAQIKTHALAWSIQIASVAEIDQINILQASLLAMKRAIEAVASQLGADCISEVQVDGNKIPLLDLPARAIVGGDALVAEISAASILAKTARDAAMLDLDALYPAYGFAKHKGYGTAVHLAALKAHGPCPAHRRTFAPVRQMLVL